VKWVICVVALAAFLAIIAASYLYWARQYTVKSTRVDASGSDWRLLVQTRYKNDIFYSTPEYLLVFELLGVPNNIAVVRTSLQDSPPMFDSPVAENETWVYQWRESKVVVRPRPPDAWVEISENDQGVLISLVRVRSNK
jgi:hypothetical protein